MCTTRLPHEDFADRTRRAVEAAAAAGRELGMLVKEPKVLNDLFSVVVHLAPTAVVARVPIVLPPGLEAGALVERQMRELSLVSWLTERRYPIVRPSPLTSRAPVQRDGFSMTFWELVDIDRSIEPDYVVNASLVPDLHAALKTYPGELGFLAPIVLPIPICLAFIEKNPHLLAPADFERAKREWALLRPLLSSREGFAARFPRATVQPIHGDAPSYNLIATTSGPRHADFEDVTLGPVEWDLALLGPAAVAAYDAAAPRAGVRVLDPDVLRVMNAARMLQIVACFALVPQLPMLADTLAPSLDNWRKMPFAGGLG